MGSPFAETPKGLSWIIQDYTKGQEGVVFYYRHPYMRKGHIKNVG